MPKKMERELKAEARRKGLSGDRADAYVYGTMRKKGWKPKREKHSMGTMRKKALGAGAVLLLLSGIAGAAVTPPTVFRTPARWNPYSGSDITRGVGGTLEVVDVPTDATSPPNYGTCLTWIPWVASASASDTTGYAAVYVYLKMESGDQVKVRAFGPSLGTSIAADRDLTLDTDESEALPFVVDSLWIWDESGTSTLRIIAF